MHAAQRLRYSSSTAAHQGRLIIFVTDAVVVHMALNTALQNAAVHGLQKVMENSMMQHPGFQGGFTGVQLCQLCLCNWHAAAYQQCCASMHEGCICLAQQSPSAPGIERHHTERDQGRTHA